MSPGTGVYHILLIAESRAVVASLDRFLLGFRYPYRSTALPDLQDALGYLDRLEDPETPDVDLPHLLILGPNLSGPDGVPSLSRLKDHPILKTIPVVVLPAWAPDAIRKPDAWARPGALIETLHSAWHRTASRPPRDPPNP